MTVEMPVAGRVAWWGTAFLRGLVGPDDYGDAVLAGDAAHVLAGPSGPMTLLEATAALRRDGATALGAAFPAPGDPTGLAGPSAFSMAATDAGEAVVAIGVRTEPGTGWVPQRVGRAVEWTTYDARRRMPPDLGEADRTLRRTLLESANELARLDVARWRPEVADALHDLRAGDTVRAPAGVPARAVDLARRALHLQEVVDLALDSEGGAVSAGEIAARRAALLPLGTAARHALTAACAPDGWPDG
ncbi:hypothetical protein DJ010_07275 [Nocardioides silvaticus]|uniref:Uncharacterized protein n=1 Tax=Nocardioides silvaticus TaxID=2201891 RepID=A0A316TH43_9ACTN|nr:hypothetical protein [Nocardioides silvaticus]PWN03857.1 hypothetical protein DJ010_07275 [Nocardioides silvaticus]